MSSKGLVRTLFTDHWIGVRSRETAIEAPTEEQLLDAVRRLDGHQRTLVSCNLLDGRNFMVGGGPTHYVVCLGDPETQHYDTLPGAGGDEWIAIRAGGQDGDYPAKEVVDRAQALEAASRVWHAGELPVEQQGPR
jgi:Immunity protein Imm1